MPSDNNIQRLVDDFSRGLKSGRTAHAYLVIGAPRGAAREFTLAALACLFPAEAGAGFDPEKHPDIIWTEPRKRSRILGIDAIREIRQRMSQTSFLGGWKAVVICAADRIGEDGANAFLKTLEEPAGKAIFFLLTDRPEAVISTIASRCQRLVLGGESEGLPEEWRERLAGLLTDAVGRESLAGQVPGRRLASFLSEIKKTVEDTLSKTEQMATDDEETLDARISARYREYRTAVMQYMLLWQRDILLCACGSPEAVRLQAKLPILQKQAEGLTPEEAIRRVGVIERLAEQLDKSLDETSSCGAAFSALETARDSR